ncbi:MAG: insulinase family protein [Alicyclobacillaceae bacterium]|nr:insulinase family protein [Alicyclobacillaceae bacterium]
MTAGFETVQVPGGYVHVWNTAQFHTVTMAAYWSCPLDRETVTAVSLLPHVLLRGTRRLPQFDDIQNAFSDLYGASVHADAKRKGEVTTLEFVVQVPAGAHIDPGLDLTTPALELLREVMWDPFEQAGSFEESRVQAEKGQHRKRIASLLDDKILYAAQRCVAEMFSGQAYGVPRYGFEEDLDKIDGRSLFALYDQIREGPVHLFVVGPVDPDPIGRWAETRLPAARASRVPSPGEPFVSIRSPRTVEESMDVAQGKLNIGYRTGIGWRDGAFPALMMYNGIFGGFPHSKLFMSVRERANLAYYASSRLDVHKGVVYVQTGIPSEHMGTVLDIVDRQTEAMERGDITAEEWTWTRIGLQNQYRELQDSPYGVIDMTLTGLLHGRERSPQDLVQELEAVKMEDVVAVAKRVEKDTIYFLRGKGGEAHEGAGL